MKVSGSHAVILVSIYIVAEPRLHSVKVLDTAPDYQLCLLVYHSSSSSLLDCDMYKMNSKH